jgi:hypothetical protein
VTQSVACVGPPSTLPALADTLTSVKKRYGLSKLTRAHPRVFVCWTLVGAQPAVVDTRHNTCEVSIFQLFIFISPKCQFAPAITESRPRIEGWDPREPRTNEQGPYESTRKQLFECLVCILVCAPALLHEVVDSKFQVQVFRAK